MSRSFPTLTAQLFQQRLDELGVRSGELKQWARAHALGNQYVLLRQNVVGEALSKDGFLIRLATQLGLDPTVVILTAHADRSEPPYRNLFLGARERYLSFPQVAKGWTELDDHTRQLLLRVISRPDLARQLATVIAQLQEGVGHG